MKHIRHYAEAKKMMEEALSKDADDAYAKEWRARLDAADHAQMLVDIEIRVSWRRNRDGEHNPRADVSVCTSDPTYGTACARSVGRASGCGYDKRSAAVSEALEFEIRKSDDASTRTRKRDALAAIDRFVIEHGPELWKEYVVGKKPFPHLQFGGKGMETFTRLFCRLGSRPYGRMPVRDFLIDYRETDAGDDFYHVVRKSLA